jgi:hypothetical protein
MKKAVKLLLQFPKDGHVSPELEEALKREVRTMHVSGDFTSKKWKGVSYEQYCELPISE